MEHWNWFMGGVALGGVAVFYTATVGRPLGVSAAYAGVVRPVDDDEEVKPPLQRRLRFVEQVAFLIAIAVGAAASALLAGTWGTAVASGLGPTHQALFGSGASSALLLLAGGVLSGFGVQWARGCTSGHGLVGVARLQGPSLVATAAFFGTAIVVSLAVDALLGAT